MTKLTMIWWNVQRLLRPIDSPLSRSLEATARHGWNEDAYKKKINAAASVLHQITGGETPALIGLAEVEDNVVVKDIINAVGWSELVEPLDDNPWLVGTDVTLLYSKKIFELARPVRSYNVHNMYATRDIFEIHLRVKKSGHEIKILANHWPSRRISNSEHFRIGLSDFCRRIVQNVLKVPKEDLIKSDGTARLPERPVLEQRWNRDLLIMGDFNDEPFNVSTSQYLGATRNRELVTAKPRLPKGTDERSVATYLRISPDLYNPSWSLLTSPKGPSGTTFWSGNWYLLDHIMVSRGLLVGDGLRYIDGSLRFFAPKNVPDLNGGSPIAMLTRSSRPRPFDGKTGRGVSDHLPLVWEIELRD